MKVCHREDTVYIELEGDISFSNAQEIRKTIIDNLLPADRKAVVNLSRVDFMDSSGLGLFITLLKRMKGRGGKLILEYPQLGIQKFLEITRMDELMEIRKAEESKTGDWPEAKK
ncbi:STAS domain-containing protein [Eubacteriales bacterium mix99]|jgi:anti-anti-sigma factor